MYTAYLPVNEGSVTHLSPYYNLSIGGWAPSGTGTRLDAGRIRGEDVDACSRPISTDRRAQPGFRGRPRGLQHAGAGRLPASGGSRGRARIEPAPYDVRNDPGVPSTLTNVLAQQASAG